MSTSRMDSSASGLTPISSSAWRDTARMASVSTSVPDSLAISMDTGRSGSASPTGAAAGGGPVRYGVHGWGALLGVPPGVGVDDLADQLVPDDVRAGQLGEVHVVQTLQDLPDHPQAAGR